MAIDNYTILDKAWLEGTNDYQQRIPRPAQQGVAASVAALTDPRNFDLWNQFVGTLNNTIAYSTLDYARWQSPFDTFRLANLPWGHAVREMAFKWFKAHAFSDNSKNLLDVYRPEIEQWFYEINYAVKYPWTINRPELIQAMSGPDGSTAMNDLYIGASVTAYNSDSYDIANTCVQLFSEADRRWGVDGNPGLMRLSVPKDGDDKANATSLLKAVRSTTYKWRWPSQLYNHIDVPVFVQNNELTLFTTTDEMASLEVDAYAELFNMTEAEVRQRIIVLPELPLANARAILAGDSFIHWHDTVFGVYGSFYDIDNLNDQFRFHHQAAIAPNPAAPVVVFYDGDATGVVTVEMNAVTLSLEAANESVVPGGTVDIITKLEGTVTENDGGIEVKPDSALYTVTTDQGSINSSTYVDKYGTLHLQKSGIPVGAELTVTGVSTYVNPSGETLVLTDSVTVNVVEPTEEGTYTVTYDMKGDGTYGIPGDVSAPSDIVADKGQTVTLAPKPKTAWTTSDGTEGGVAGTWTFTGWSTTASGTPETASIASIAADTKVYGVWTFAES